MTLQSNLSAVEINPSTKPEATIIWLHGLGADGHDFVDIVPQLNLPNVRFIFPHAPVRPITLNGGYPMRGWYDIYDLIDRSREDEIGVRESAELIDALIQREIDNGIPTEKILLAGFSQGCAMALYSGLRYPKKLGGILGLSGYLPLAKTLAAEASELNKTIPIFMAHGTQDQIVNVQFAEQSRDVLESLGYAINFHYYPMAHSVCADEVKAIAEWFRQTLSTVSEAVL